MIFFFIGQLDIQGLLTKVLHRFAGHFGFFMRFFDGVNQFPYFTIAHSITKRTEEGQPRMAAEFFQ